MYFVFVGSTPAHRILEYATPARAERFVFPPVVCALTCIEGKVYVGCSFILYYTMPPVVPPGGIV